MDDTKPTTPAISEQKKPNRFLKCAKDIAQLCIAYICASLVAGLCISLIFSSIILLNSKGIEIGELIKILKGAFFIGVLISNAVFVLSLPGALITILIAKWKSINTKAYFLVMSVLTSISASLLLSQENHAKNQDWTGYIPFQVMLAIAALAAGYVFWRMTRHLFTKTDNTQKQASISN